VRVEDVGGLSLQTLVQDGSRAQTAPNYVTRHCISSSSFARIPKHCLHKSAQLACDDFA